ncbi:hypothetical protein C8Z91_33895 [Paenibacillus elgii]|uniref:Uncharacterized protein n=1 Tax=Paenibacillus elgii TaxID=189691 RepID=A0A2T6FSI8_9BACL|nr:hypothetical protein [Paenibacillus elgii]PUA34865.1 hypothetical protein C8Z91_33895 [Paenibacillus elgii]
MSEQIPDYFKYNKENNDKYSKKKHYELAAIEKDWPFIPETYGYHLVDHFTGCWRGFHCLYEMDDLQLLLKSFFVTLDCSVASPPDLNGVAGKKGYGGFWEYKQVNLPLDYSGGIILCADVVGPEDWCSDYERTHHFRDVMELRFENGVLTSKTDHSDTMKEIRGFTDLSFHEQEELVADYFSLYSNKWINHYKL